MQDISNELNTTNLTNGTGLDLGIDPHMISTVVTLSTVASILLTVLFVIYLIRNAIHRKKSERTILEMAQNIKDIKALLESRAEQHHHDTPDTSQSAPVRSMIEP